MQAQTRKRQHRDEDRGAARPGDDLERVGQPRLAMREHEGSDGSVDGDELFVTDDVVEDRAERGTERRQCGELGCEPEPYEMLRVERARFVLGRS